MNEQRQSRTELRAERGERYTEERSFAVPIVLGIVAVVASLSVGGYYFYTTAEMFNPYGEMYEKLGVHLPRSFERADSAPQLLDQVKREPCDQVAVFALAQLMESAGYPRESAISMEKYIHSCSFSEEMLKSTYRIYLRIGDTKAAINAADDLVRFDAANYNYRFMRGNAYSFRRITKRRSRTTSARSTCFLTCLRLLYRSFMKSQICTIKSVSPAMRSDRWKLISLTM